MQRDTLLPMNEPKLVYIEAILMPNGEILHYGKSLGFVNDEQMRLVESGSTKLVKGLIPIVAIKPNVA